MKMEKQIVWEEVLETVCGCYADEVGNRACDWGAICDKCHATWVREIFESRLKEKGLAD